MSKKNKKKTNIQASIKAKPSELKPSSLKSTSTEKQANLKHELPIKIIKKDLVKTALFALFSIGMIIVLKKLNISF